MIVDLLESASTTTHVECDVFIAGAGPAGISLALELARARPDWHIVLGEAGAVGQPTARERDIYQLELGEKSYSVLDISRRRQLGGTSIHWGGWSKPPDPVDFETNPQWQVPAWPFGPQELAPFIPAACQWCEIDTPLFDSRQLHSVRQKHLLDFGDNSPVAEQLFRFSPPTRFAARYYAKLEAQDNLTCLLHANLLGVESLGDSVKAALVAPLDRSPTRVEARYFVLAMGGIETTRHLLNWRGDRKADGEGLYSPHLGHYFADHFGFSPGTLLAPADLHYSRFGDASGPSMPVLTFAEHEIRAADRNNSCVYLWAQQGDDSLLATYGGIASLGFKAGEYWHYQVKMIAEPQPNHASSISLTNQRCPLGLRRARLRWQLRRPALQRLVTLAPAEEIAFVVLPHGRALVVARLVEMPMHHQLHMIEPHIGAAPIVRIFAFFKRLQCSWCNAP